MTQFAIKASRKNRAMYAPLFAYIAITCLIVATGIYTFAQVENVIEGGELHDLGVIANAKVAQVTSWRENQLRIGEALFRDPSLATEFEQWQREGMPGNSRKRNLVRLLAELQHANEDKTFLLVDQNGKVRVAVSEDYVPNGQESALAMEAMTGGKVLFSDFHRHGGEDRSISIDLAVPLTAMPGKRIVGAMVLQIDPHKFLYPLIQSGTSQDSSVETLLMRREGDEVLILNELRHSENSALSLRVPISATNQIAVMAIRGETGTADGIDYRGIPVVAGLRAIPGSTWFMATKIDKDELFAPIYRLKTWTLFLGLMFSAFVGGLLIFWLKGVRMQHKLLVAQRDAAIERERLVKHFEYLSKYASDIIMVADERGRIVDVNERALEIFGYTRDEFLRMAIADLRTPTEDSAILNGQIEQIKARGELRYETIVRRKDGTTLPLEVSMRLIEVQGIKYLQGIGRDITERRSIEENLRNSEALLKESQRMAKIGSWELDLINNVLTWTDENYRIFEVEKTQFGTSYEAFLNVVHPDDRAMVNKAYTDSLKDKTPYDIVHRLQLPEQRIKYVREWCETFYDQDGHPLRSVGTSQDVTERILNEHKILRLNNFYAALSRTNEAIARIGNQDMLFQEICNIAVEHGQFKLAWIGLVDDQTRTVNVAAFSGEASGYLDNIHVSTDAAMKEGRGPTGTTARNNTETILNDFFHDPSTTPWHENAGKYGLLASAACPLALEGKVVGVLTLYAGERNYFDQELANLLSDLSRDISYALSNFAREAQRKQTEVMLRESEEKFRTLVTNLPERIFVKNADLAFIACNDLLARDMGIEPDEIIGKTDYDFFPEKLAALYQENDRRIMSSGQVESFEERIILEGEERYISTIKAPYRDNQGRIVGVIGAFWDVTESRLLAEMQRKSAEEVEDLYENAPCGYHSLDRDSIIVRINNTELQWLGYTREEVVGKMSFADLHTVKSQRKFRKNFVLLKEHGVILDQEYELIRKDGTTFPVLINASAVLDADGRFLMSRSTLHDITERKFAQEALQESELLFRTMVDNAPMIIWVSDTSRGNSYQGFNFFNKRWHEFTGHTLDGTQGYNWMCYVHPDDRDRCLNNYQDAFKQAQPFRHEYRLLRRDGVYRWMDDSGVPRFMDGGKFLGHIGICVDITEQKEFEAMRAQMEHAGRLNIAGEMASGIAHELSQPLTACNNYLDGCLRRMDDSEWDKDKLRNAVQLACKQASRAGKIINHLKGLVRKQGHERVLFDLNTLIEDVLTFLEDEIRHYGISINIALCDHPKIMGSKVEIEQVFLNLCKNAIEAMSVCPRRELYISTRIIDAGHIRVEVRDTGAGFLPDEAENLFNPFHTSKKDGLGLGLAICRSFIENHGGRIWAVPQQESGAEFCFTLSVRGDKEYA